MKKPRNRLAPPATRPLAEPPTPPAPQPSLPPLDPIVPVRALMAQWYEGVHYERGATIRMSLSEVARRAPSLVVRL